MKKRISMKECFSAFWKGVCRAFRAFGKLLGIKEGYTYVRTVWRLTVGVIATLALLVSTILLYAFVTEIVYPKWIRPCFTEPSYKTTNLSSQIIYRRSYRQGDGQIYDKTKKKVLLDNIEWLYRSEDSLVVFAKNNRRGFLNRFTGEVVVQPIYSRAWVFSEGLAAVERDGELLFIDQKGNIVIDKGLEVVGGDAEYVFHNGYCKVQNTLDGKEGIIDRQGNYALLPEYSQIWNEYGLWKVQKDGYYGLFSASMDTLYTADKAEINVSENAIEVRFKDHTAQWFDHAGNLLIDFVIDDISNMRYATTELYRPENAEGCYDDEVYAIADCQKYMVRCNWTEYYGLIDRNGHRITLPHYTSIEAIAKDLYLCQPHGIVINSQGKRVE